MTHLVVECDLDECSRRFNILSNCNREYKQPYHLKSLHEEGGVDRRMYVPSSQPLFCTRWHLILASGTFPSSNSKVLMVSFAGRPDNLGLSESTNSSIRHVGVLESSLEIDNTKKKKIAKEKKRRK